MRWFLLAMTLLWATVASALEPNLLSNDSFESDLDKDGVADGWFSEVHRNEGGEGTFALDSQVKVKGKFSQHIHHSSEKGWVRVSQDGIPAKPNALHLFRCWVKANCRFLLIVYTFRTNGNYDTFVIAEGHGTGDEGRGTGIKGNGWQLFNGLVRTPSDARSIKVSLVTDSQGDAWFDEAELILLERPPYTFVSATNSAPRLDGDLSDACWRDAEPLTPFLELGTSKFAEPATMAKLAATPTHLFVAFRCNEPTPQAIRLRTPESGEPAYMDDCVEVYLDPSHRHDGFWQFVVTPKGNRWAQQVETSRWAQVWWLLPRPTQRLIADGWQAATKIGSDHWTVEIAIPFSLLGIQPKTGTVVGINLCRSRKTGRGMGDEGQIQNSAFAYLAEQTFQRPERFPHAVFVGIGDRGLGTGMSLFGSPKVRPPEKDSFRDDGRARLLPSPKTQSSQMTVTLTALVPRPQRIVQHRGTPIMARSPVRIILPDGASDLERTAATQLIQTLQRKGFTATFSQHLTANAPAIILATLDRLPSPLSASLPLPKLRTFFAQRGEEAYAMFIGTGGEGRGTKEKVSRAASTPRLTPRAPCIFVLGSSPRGVFNGVQTLRQMVWIAEKCNGQIALPPCEIWDYPDLKLRGWHFVAPLRHELPFAEKLLDWLALMKFNTLVIEVDDRFPYESHPDIAHPQAMTKEQWHRFLAKAQQLGFEVIPQVQTFGHFGYVLSKPTYRHLSEHKEPHPRWGFYAYCPSNPETYRLVFDLFDEVLEAFKPRWFHIGHDEITFVPIGVCERCKTTGKTAWQLLAEDIQRLYDYLKAKGIERVAMWCDQLEPDRTGGYAPYFTHFAADLIPKDIVQFCWHYDARQTFPWLTRLRDKGFDVVACGWYHAQNVWRFSAESFDRRAIGYCGTTWYGVRGFADQVDLMAAVVLGAQNSWSVDNPTIDMLPHPTNIAQDLWALVGERTRFPDGIKKFVTVDLSPLVNASLSSWGSEGVIPDRCRQLELVDRVVWLEGLPFRLVKTTNSPPQVVALSSETTSHEVAPDLVAIPVDGRAKALYLLMTTTARTIRTEDLYGRGRTDPRKVATLTVHYADGSEERFELVFRRHLTEWNDRLGCSHARIAWQGKTERGYFLTLCVYEWRNPKPNVTVSHLVLTSAGTSVQPVLIALTVLGN